MKQHLFVTAFSLGTKSRSSPFRLGQFKYISLFWAGTVAKWLRHESAPFLSFFITSSSPDFLLIGEKRGLAQRKAASSLAFKELLLGITSPLPPATAREQDGGNFA